MKHGRQAILQLIRPLMVHFMQFQVKKKKTWNNMKNAQNGKALIITILLLYKLCYFSKIPASPSRAALLPLSAAAWVADPRPRSSSGPPRMLSLSVPDSWKQEDTHPDHYWNGSPPLPQSRCCNPVCIYQKSKLCVCVRDGGWGEMESKC